jgi:pimeloyl-ACP methyl ester carboxylesterase
VKRAILPLVLAVLALAQLTGCSSSNSSAVDDQPVPIATADYSGTGPGSLIEAKTIPHIDRAIPLGTTSARVVYRSTSGIDGSPTEVSGAVFVPPGRPPKGGWPVIAYAHGTTGVSQECGPSLSPQLWGFVEPIGKLLRIGFAVAATDYQGLGAPGAHPYLDAKTAGFNVIDSVRALRAVSRDVSKTWSAYGGSQGGAASWAANEQASTYATDLNLVGSASLVPPADISDYAALANDGALNKDQRAAYIGILIGLERTRNGFNIDEYRHGLAEEKWDVLSACYGPKAEERAKVIYELPAEDLMPATPEAQQLLFALLKEMSLPQQRAAAPMLIIYAGQDTFIPPQATEAAIARACAMGDTVQTIFQADKGHGDVDGTAYVEWLGERLSGLPAPSNC